MAEVVVKFGSDTADFSAELAVAQRQMQLAAAEMKKFASEVVRDGDSMDAAKAALASWSSKANAAKSRIAELSGEMGKTGSSPRVPIPGRSDISSRALSAHAFADAARSHWAIANNPHWMLDATFKEDRSRRRGGRAAPKTSPSSDPSPAIWSARPKTNDPSYGAASAPHGTPNASSRSSVSSAVNLDSVPWPALRRFCTGTV